MLAVCDTETDDDDERVAETVLDTLEEAVCDMEIEGDAEFVALTLYSGETEKRAE